jgi:hypothetical protein
MDEKDQEILRLRAKVAKLEKEIADIVDGEYGVLPGGLDHLFKEPSRRHPKPALD